MSTAFIIESIEGPACFDFDASRLAKEIAAERLRVVAHEILEDHFDDLLFSNSVKFEVEEFFRGIPFDTLVSLDGGDIFIDCTNRLEISRTAFSQDAIRNGPYKLHNRLRFPPIPHQIMKIADGIRAGPNSSRVALLDDSVGIYSVTLGQIIPLLTDAGISVSHCFCLSKPKSLESVLGVPVSSMFQTEQNLFALRDLTLGFDRSGIQCCIDRSQFEFPLWIDLKTMSCRMKSIPEGNRAIARSKIIECSIELYRQLEKEMGRPLRLGDLEGLRGLDTFLGKTGGRVIEFLELISDPIERIEDALNLPFQLTVTKY